MVKRKVYRKKWMMLFIVVLMVSYLCMPAGYASAAVENITSATANQQLALAAAAKLSETKATVVIGNTLTLTVKNLDDSKVSSVKWKANRPSIAKVSQEGVVTPVKIGTTTIKCIITYKDKTEQTLSCTVTVKNRVKATKVIITNKSVSLQVGKTVVLKTKLSPANTTDQIYWFTSDKTVATVGLTSGKVTAKKAGTVVITAKVGKDRKDAGAKTNKVLAEIKIEVTSKDESKDATDANLFTWSENENGLTITGYKNGLPKDVVIPEKINGKSVTQIGYSAFASCRDLNSVVIPKSVTQIGRIAFQYCSSLKEVTIPDGVTEIAWKTFAGCSNLSSVTIPKSVAQIGYGAFLACSGLKDIVIPEGVIEIDSSAFSWCSNLKSVTIPKSLTEIGGNAFYNCSALEKIIIPEGVTRISWETFEGCSSLSSVTIPESITKIELSAFRNCSSLKEIVIPEGVTQIDDSAFDGIENLEIHGEKDSYAQEYAQKHGIAFIEK